MNYYEKLDYDVSIREETRTEFPAHYHEKTEILLVHTGSCDMLIGDTIYTLRAGDIAVAFPNVVHGYPCMSSMTDPQKPNESVMIIIDMEYASSYQRSLLQTTPVCPVIRAAEVHPDLYYAIDGMVKAGRKDTEAIGVYFQLFVMRILRSVPLCENREPLHGDIIHRLITYLSENYLDNLTLDSIAAALNCDKYRISRILSKELHTSLSDYVNELRINEAKKLIASTDMPLSEISPACGFSNVRTFNRNFTARCGMSPREYRRNIVR